jgi:hypothetical protein
MLLAPPSVWMNDITNECPVYKAAYERIYRQVRRERIAYYIITNEYSRRCLKKMLTGSWIDGVVHVHKATVVDVCQLDGQLTNLVDLVDFINAASQW